MESGQKHICPRTRKKRFPPYIYTYIFHLTFVASLNILNPPIPTPPKKHLMVHALMVWREESASQFAN